jgi:peptidyl-prolyl cis-trans isomerase B (cyclophilin B)
MKVSIMSLHTHSHLARIFGQCLAVVASLALLTLVTACGDSTTTGSASAQIEEKAVETAEEKAKAEQKASDVVEFIKSLEHATSKPGAPAQPAPATATPLTAVFECDSGTIRVELATKEAPRLCANFINLVNRGYYDGQPWADFSRVVRQTGINAAGDPAYSLPREFGTNLFFDKPGRLCYSNNSDDVSTARSKPTRIFITVRPQDRWNLQYAVFGTIVEGLDVAMNLKDGEKIVRVQIEGDFAAHQARFSKQIAEWNAALDKVGLVERR